VAIGNPVGRGVTLLTVLMLIALAIWGGTTGARTDIVFFKICPFVKSFCALLALTSAWTGVGIKE
ncbi:MAG: hypothetical protein ACE5JA_06080, partial [bacterium]